MIINIYLPIIISSAAVYLFIVPIREHGVETIKAVNLAILEVDGNISVLSDNFTNKSVKKRKGHKIISKNG